MPELPEVETIRRGLATRLVGRTICSVEVLDSRLTHRSNSDPVSVLQGATVRIVGRRAKWLLVGLGSDFVWVMHMRMSGRLLAGPPFANDARPRAELTFDDGSSLRFVDPRRFGELLVVTRNAAADLSARIGPEADTISTKELRQALAGRKAMLKGLLTNQSAIGGIGSIYADEALWRARLPWNRRAGTLDDDETRRLASAIRVVMRRAIGAGGTSARDGLYVDTNGTPGAFSAELETYQRAGKECSRCRTPIERAKSGSTSSYFCPTCQT